MIIEHFSFSTILLCWSYLVQKPTLCHIGTEFPDPELTLHQPYTAEPVPVATTPSATIKRSSSCNRSTYDNTNVSLIRNSSCVSSTRTSQNNPQTCSGNDIIPLHSGRFFTLSHPRNRSKTSAAPADTPTAVDTPTRKRSTFESILAIFEGKTRSRATRHSESSKPRPPEGMMARDHRTCSLPRPLTSEFRRSDHARHSIHANGQCMRIPNMGIITWLVILLVYNWSLKTTF